VPDELITFIAAEPGMAAQLLAQHTDDGTGRCRVCSSGAQSGHYQHPCAIWLAADEASRRSGEVHP
jgi:hypothetical protein